MPPVLGRPAGYGALQPGGGVLRSELGSHSRPAFALPPWNANRASRRGRPSRLSSLLRDVGNRVIRRGLQARAARAPRCTRQRAQPADRWQRRPSGRRSLPGDSGVAHARSPHRFTAADLADGVMKPVASRISVANAPCSYGAFELTVDDPNVAGPLAVLDGVAGGGCAG